MYHTVSDLSDSCKKINAELLVTWLYYSSANISWCSYYVDSILSSGSLSVPIKVISAIYDEWDLINPNWSTAKCDRSIITISLSMYMLYTQKKVYFRYFDWPFNEWNIFNEKFICTKCVVIVTFWQLSSMHAMFDIQLWPRQSQKASQSLLSHDDSTRWVK